MSVHDYNTLSIHLHHEVVVVAYGCPVVNVAIECETCHEVLLDYDNPSYGKKKAKLKS